MEKGIVHYDKQLSNASQEHPKITFIKKKTLPATFNHMLLSPKNLKALLRAPAIPLMGEGGAMLLCVPAALHFADGTAWTMAACGLFVLLIGLLLHVSTPRLSQQPETRISYLIVAFLWLLFTLFATLPFMATGALTQFSPAFFEAMSGLTSTGATVVSDTETLPASIILWRSVTQWIGGYGIVVLVLAVVPSLGINKYSLYTAEASGADNTSKATTSMAATIRQTLVAYFALTL
ncbi:MAG: potassium transporter TrkG, partial [Bacteroidales bacterium]|nr:potassium transporter TrkG [Bacteroidales bacterium]